MDRPDLWLIAAMLFGPKVMYQAMERIVIGMVVFITLGLIFVAFQVGTMEHVSEMARGLVNFGHIELTEDFPFSRFFGAVVFAGAGGAGNLWYAFYLRDKNIGMGARMPRLQNPLRGGSNEEEATGYLYPETEANQLTGLLDVKREIGSLYISPLLGRMCHGIIPARPPFGEQVVRAPKAQVERDLGGRPEKTRPRVGELNKGLAVTQPPSHYQQDRQGDGQQPTPRAEGTGLTHHGVTPVQSFG